MTLPQPWIQPLQGKKLSEKINKTLQIKKRGLGRQISNDYKCETGGVNEGQL